MKKLLFLLLIVVVVPLAGKNIVKLTVVHTNDLHAHIQQNRNCAGFARIAAFIKQIRREQKNVIVLDAGDEITGTPVSSVFKGEPIFEIISAMGYTAATLGNHEFDWGWQETEKYLQLAKYPILCSNAYDPNGKLIGDAPEKIFNINGIKVGVIGMVTEDVPQHVVKSKVAGVKFLAEIPTMKRYVEKIKPKCDFLIVLTHIGVEHDKRLAGAVRGIDLIVGGHSHTVIKTPIKVDNTYIVQAGGYGHYVGLVEAEIDLDDKKVLSLTGRLIKAADLPPPDSKVQALVDQWEKKVAAKVDKKIGMASKSFSISDLKQLFQKVLKLKAHTDFGYYNLHGIRSRLYKGEVTARNIWDIEPFGNHIVIAEILGKDLGGALLRRLNRQKFTINPKKVYSIATNNYVTSQPERFIGKPIKITDTDFSVRNAVIDYICKKESISPEK